jgi:outer membrane protein OmpA-like peptidoglycan-associated protein
MYKKIFSLSIILLPVLCQAQLGNMLKRAKNNVEKRVDRKIDTEVDKTLDQLEGKQPAANSTAAAKPSPAPAPAPAPAPTPELEKPAKETVKSFSRFDFVPGERIIYSEDFAQDAVGELPLTWNASGKGEVMTIEGKAGKWLRAFENTTYLTGNKKAFGEDYTIEFDLMFFFDPKVKGYVLPNWKTGIFSSGKTDQTDNAWLRDQQQLNNTVVTIDHGSNGGAILVSHAKRAQTFRSDRMQLGDLTPTFNKVMHYAIQVQKTRFRLWIEDRKVFDIPRAVNVGDTMNQLYFFLEGSNYKEDEIGLFISNIKIATGLPDTRHKLIDEGKFSTTGILFDVAAATIKPESGGVLKEIGTLLKEHKDVKLKIIGHTDSDGADAANLDLSKKRAEAVKAALVKEFSIDESRLQTDGKGETSPVGDNKTKEGKAQNRRVEFIKL